MRELSLHILDLVQNSITAGASLISVQISLTQSVWTIHITDNGKGMAPELLAQVQSPFSTTRTERKVGLGIPLMTANARLTGGDVTIQSTPGHGCQVTAVFYAEHVDCLPMGDLAGTLLSLVIANPDQPDFSFEIVAQEKKATFDTRIIRNALGGVPLNTPEVIDWMRKSLYEEIEPIVGGTEYEIHR